MKNNRIFIRTLIKWVEYKFLLFILMLLACNSVEDKSRDEIIENNGRRIIKIYYESKKLNIEYEVDLNGQPDGYYKEYYQNGNVKNFYNYNRGSLHGIQRRFYENGNLKSVSYYKSSRIDSSQKWYYLTGRIKSEFYWIDGKRFGLQKEYNQEGIVDNMYFISSACDSCMTLDLGFDKKGEIANKNGNLITCVYSKGEASIIDTVKALFYVAVPDAYDYSCKFIQKKENKYRVERVIKLSDYNNNKAFLFEDKLKEPGTYILGLSVKLIAKNSKNVISDSVFLPITVTK